MDKQELIDDALMEERPEQSWFSEELSGSSVESRLEKKKTEAIKQTF